MASPQCTRCAKPASDPLDVCWACHAKLCPECHERFGVCAAPRCVELQAELSRARSTKEQAAVLAKAGPIGEPYVKKLVR